MSSIIPRIARQAVRPTTRRGLATVTRAIPRNSRFYSTEPPKSEAPKSSSSSTPFFIGGAAALAGGLYWYLQSGPTEPKKRTQADYQAVYDEIAAQLVEKDDYDDGSYGPVLLRLAWHASGTYDKATGTGGSNGATMRFAPESGHGANAGLAAARDFLEPIKQKFPWISYSDLWILGGVCAIQQMQGPTIPYRPGRTDGLAANCTPDGRLPDATQGPRHLRDIFYRMGFNDQEIVALSGAHALGRCHTNRSGFDGPWTFSPTTLTNDYYTLLLNEKWQWRKWDGPKQLEDKGSKSLMMLPTDYCLIEDKSFRPWVETYAKDNDKFFEDFGKVVLKLFELGVPFKADQTERMVFKVAE